MPMPDPVILSIGAFQLRWYGLFAALALLGTYAILSLRVKKSPLKSDDLSTILTFCVIFGLIGARLEYVRRFWSESFADDPMGVWRVWEGGLVFQGGFILAAIAVWLLCLYKKWPVGGVADLMAPALPVGHAIARLGCLFNGCCFGIPWKHFGGIQYPASGNDVLHTQFLLGQLPEGTITPLPVLPIQALEALWCLLIAGAILLCERMGLLKKRLFFLYLIGYSIGRFFLEFLRGDYHQNGGLTPAQWTTAALILPVTIAILLWASFRRPSHDSCKN